MVFFVNNFINVFKVLHIKVHFVKCLIWVAVEGTKKNFFYLILISATMDLSNISRPVSFLIGHFLQ